MSGPNEAPWWYVLRDAKTWTLLEAAYICCNKPIVTREHRRLTKTAHPADIETMAQRLMAEVPKEKVRTRYWRHYNWIFQRAAVEAFAKQNGFQLPWETSAESQPSSATPTETLLRQVAVLALALAEKSDKYRHGEKPNADAIAKAVQDILAGLPDANTRGLSKRSIRDSIRDGLRLLLDN